MKNIKRIAEVALCVVLLVSAGLAFWLRANRRLTVSLDALQPTQERDFMRASLTYDAGTRTLRGTQTLQATNRGDTARTEAVLRLYMNGETGSSAAVTGVQVDGVDVSYAQDEDDPTVLRIPLNWAAGQTVELTWTVMVKHAKADAAAVITLPALAVFENGAWRTDAFDALAEPSYAEAFDYVLELICADSTQAAFGGALTNRRWGTGVGETLYTVQMQGARDVAFALGYEGAVRQNERDGVLITALAGDGGTAGNLLSRAKEALEALDDLGLGYPFLSLSVVEADTGREDGLALSGLVALAQDGDKEAQLRRMTRLVARQTFGVLVESDPWQAPWLSQTLASTVELLSFRARKGVGAFETRVMQEIEVATRLTRPYGVTVGAGVDHFGGDTEMTQVLRDQGAAMMLGIELAVGEAPFWQALTAYVEQSAGRIATQGDLETALYEATGSRWDGYLQDELTW